MASSAPGRGVLGTAVLFRPGDEVAGALRALAAQVDALVVVDNTPGPGFPSDRVWPRLPDHVRWLALHENTGIAHALNQGLRVAVEEGREWMVAFDQDSVVEDGYVERMLEGAARRPAGGAAMFVPALPGDGGGAGLGEVPRGITSGSLARVAALQEVGGYREDLFIDYVDFELCLRLRARGYAIVRNGDVVLGHRIGDPATSRLGGLRITTTNHSALRRYYKCRNRVAMVRSHFAEEPAWLTREVLSTFWEAAKITLLEEERAEKLAMMVRGVLDGLAGRMGRYDRRP